MLDFSWSKPMTKIAFCGVGWMPMVESKCALVAPARIATAIESRDPTAADENAALIADEQRIVVRRNLLHVAAFLQTFQ